MWNGPEFKQTLEKATNGKADKFDLVFLDPPYGFDQTVEYDKLPFPSFEKHVEAQTTLVSLLQEVN